MPTNLGVSEVIDKHGVTADIEAKRFDGTRTVQIQGDVTASQTWNGDSSSPLTLNASIGAKKVTQDKIGDKAVGTGQMADGSVGLTQMDSNAMNGTVQDNDSKLATHSAVKTYVDSQISGQGTYLGKHTVAEINAFVTDNLHNGDRVMVSDSGTINLGPGGVGFDVIAGEDLILYKSGSTVQWDTMDGNFKTKQNAVSKAGSTTKTVTAFSQNENGDADVTYEEIQRASTSHEGLVQLTDSHTSTSTTTAATPKNVKEAYDLANTANTGLANKLDKTGDGKDVTVSFSEASTRANIGTGEKLSVMFGKIKKWFTDLKALAFKDTVEDSDISGTISDNHIASASTWNGKADKVGGATNGNIAALDSNGNLTDSGKKTSDFELEANKVSSWQSTPDNTHYPSEKLVKDWLDAKADANNVVAIADAFVLRRGQVGQGWYKLAETTTPRNNYNINSVFDVVVSSSDGECRGSFVMSVRYEGTGEVNVFTKSLFSDALFSNYPIKIVTTKVSSTALKVELYFGVKPSVTENAVYSGISISEQNAGNYGGAKEKDVWTYTSYTDVAGSAAPESDPVSNKVVVDVDIVYRLQNIEYVANQSGGGGNLNKTINGTTTSVLAFMNDSEAVAIWNDAKTAAANAS